MARSAPQFRMPHAVADTFLITRAPGGTGAGALNAKEAALVRILGSLWFNQVRCHADADDAWSALSSATYHHRPLCFATRGVGQRLWRTGFARGVSLLHSRVVRVLCPPPIR